MTVVQSALAPFTMKAFYLLTWGTAIGSNVWSTISLPRTTFGTLQGRLTPLYFSFQTLSTATLLLTHLWFHPALISSPLVEPHWATCEEGRQGLLILASVVPSLLNWVLVGPMATDVMLERHRLERLESKEYDEPNPSEAMSKANTKFSTLHGISSGLNTLATVALVGLGLAISM
ncbi:MAG: hypothetical protein TREMPRED_003810 [Tremellales sp. Tagirdzhanova-0007]|nr:MAG: hypothetical protein TREMPRED_003810 [Tremellales sp. Tagirdzhanova-0007]